MAAMEKQQPSMVYWVGDNLYLNITNQCSNNCYFCFRNYKNGVDKFKLKLNHDPSAAEVIDKIKDVINKRRWKEVVFCGFGEPLTRLDIVLEVTRWLKQHHPVTTVRIDTNGQAQLLHKNRNVVSEIKNAGVDKVSVSLNAHNKQAYDQICRPQFEDAYAAVLQFIKAAAAELDTEVTAVTIPEADTRRIEEMASDLGGKFRKRDYIPCFW